MTKRVLFANINVPLSLVYAAAPQLQHIEPVRLPGLYVTRVAVSPGLVTVEAELV